MSQVQVHYWCIRCIRQVTPACAQIRLAYIAIVLAVQVAVEVRMQTLYRKLILRKWPLKFSNDFNVIVDVAVHCILYTCKTFNGHSSHLCFKMEGDTQVTHTLPDPSEGAGIHLQSIAQ